MDEASKKSLQDEILSYRKLQSVALTDEFQEYSNRLIKTVSEKMIYAFTADSIKTFDDFCRVRGEIVARLQPIQEVHGAGQIAESLEQRLKEFYTTEQ